MRAVLADFERRGITYPDTPEDRRMAQVVIDQTRQARAYASYLPSTTELPLAPILAALQREPGDKRGAAHWAATAGITERTLLRHCQQHLGMSFNDWRQRCAWSARWACWTRDCRCRTSRAGSATARPRRSSRCSNG